MLTPRSGTTRDGAVCSRRRDAAGLAFGGKDLSSAVVTVSEARAAAVPLPPAERYPCLTAP